jgi:molecular chaperone DnaK
MTTRAVGIDLGTTFSAIAYVNKFGVPEILHNAEGERITPSVILFEGDDIIIGTYAKQAAVAYPEQVVEFVKRHMGDEAFSFQYRGESYTPERLSSFMLAKLKHDAELRLGHRIEQAVITVPAYFGDRQRRATVRAGEMAGFQVLALLNEPTAAAFAYGLSNRDADRRILVFDLGGGTFDVSIVRVQGPELTVIATTGDHQLGGKDWDDSLIAYTAEQFRSRHGINPLDDLAAYHEREAVAEQAAARQPFLRLSGQDPPLGHLPREVRRPDLRAAGALPRLGARRARRREDDPRRDRHRRARRRIDPYADGAGDDSRDLRQGSGHRHQP